MTARILITGSRMFTEVHTVQQAIERALDELGLSVLVHGCAPGADEIADVLAPAFGLPVERWPADWEGPCVPECVVGHRRTRRDGPEYCPDAGKRRNTAMVAAGADLCLAFRVATAENWGTRDCGTKAVRAGIPIRWHVQREVPRLDARRVRGL